MPDASSKGAKQIREIKCRLGSNAKHFLTLIDFKSAFDLVDHELLLKILKEEGLDENSLNIVAFLYNHYYFSVDGVRRYKISRGCVQGFLLSPFLFVLYINPLLKKLEELNGRNSTFAYADDVSFISLGPREVERSIATG